MTTKNTAPADQYEVLRRLYNCNWSQLADRLGVTPQTLRQWRKDGAGKTGSEKQAKLTTAAFMAADCEWLILPINWAAIATIGGKK